MYAVQIWDTKKQVKMHGTCGWRDGTALGELRHSKMSDRPGKLVSFSVIRLDLEHI